MSEALARALARMEVDYAPLGRVKSQQMWECADGWQIAWTTSKVIGGPYDGKYLVQGFRPVGKGARSGKAETWEQAYARGFAKRGKAKERAVEMYHQHNAKKGGEK
jgi:hypothetical protein